MRGLSLIVLSGFPSVNAQKYAVRSGHPFLSSVRDDLQKKTGASFRIFNGSAGEFFLLSRVYAARGAALGFAETADI
jgi:hypothetical protein